LNLYNSLIDSLPDEPFLLGKRLKNHFAVLVPFIGSKRDAILFELRAKGIRQSGEICFPGGMVEPGETPVECAIRECAEELGIEYSQIEITAKAGCIVSHRDAIIHVFIGVLNIESPAETEPNKKEVAELFAVPSSFFTETKPDIYQVDSFTETGNFPVKELKLPKRYYGTWSNGKRNIYVYKYGDKIIWGLTAAILYELISLL
jgi:8-oxo-dGTP pyrophosphatase MutT (NUDIX family)